MLKTITIEWNINTLEYGRVKSTNVGVVGTYKIPSGHPRIPAALIIQIHGSTITLNRKCATYIGQAAAFTTNQFPKRVERVEY